MASPKSIDDYELLRELGRGANGVVFAARKVGLERVVALKVLIATELDHETLGRFQIEARVASRLTDPGVVTVMDAGRDAEGRPYYVMEYCPGLTLQARLKTDGRLPVAEVLDYGAEIARILGFAHAKGVIHRDIKPANIIIDDSSGRPRITDFGLARDTQLVSSLTRSGDVIGTPLYMAPEQLRGVRAIDHRVDVYALGAILYQCLTGKHPHEARSVAELATKVGVEPIIPPSQHRDEITGDIDATILKALATDPRERHRDAQAFREELLVARKVHDLRASQRSRVIAAATRRRGLPVWALALAGVLLVAGGAAGTLAFLGSRAPEPIPSPSPSPTPSPFPSPSPSPSSSSPPPRPVPSTPLPDPSARRTVAPVLPPGPWMPGPTAINADWEVALAARLRSIRRLAGQETIYVADARDGHELFAQDEKTIAPIHECAQLVTVAAALEYIPLTKTFDTILKTSGPIHDGVLEGDLAIVGGGDPNFSEDVLTEWAKALKKVGISREIKGTIVADPWIFDPQDAVHSTWSADVLASHAGAHVVGLACHNAVVDLALVQGGRRTRVEINPTVRGYDDTTLEIDETVRGFHLVHELTRDRENRGNGVGPWRLRVATETQKGGLTRYAIVDEPALLVGELLHDHLSVRDVETSGPARLAASADETARWTLVPESPGSTRALGTRSPMIDTIDQIGRRSQPWIAECLFRQIGVARKGRGSFTASADAVKEFVAACGIPQDSLFLVDGSGNSNYTQGSARALVAVIQHALQGPANDAFVTHFNTIPASKNKIVLPDVQGVALRRNLEWLSALEPELEAKKVVLRAQSGNDAQSETIAGIIEHGDRRVLFAVVCDGAETRPLRAYAAAAIKTLGEYVARQ